MTNEFQVAKTVEPLHALLADCLARSPVRSSSPISVSETKQTAYLIDRWPDPSLPFLEMELRALQRNHVPACCLSSCIRRWHPSFTAKTNDLVTQFEYLPDALVIEAEWQANTASLRELEALRANQKHRPPSDLFLEQARCALILRRLFRQHNIGHVHATSSPDFVMRTHVKQAPRLDDQRGD